MTGVQLFLMAFGAVIAVIGVIVFFLLAWFKEATGQEHSNAIKILQAEFRFSNPALVIFAGGLLLMVAPFFLGQAMPGDQPQPNPQPNPPVQATATPVSPVAEFQPPTAAPVAGNVSPTFTPTAAPRPTDTPTPTPTATPSPVDAAPDPTGRWRNQSGFLEFRRLGTDEFVYSDFDPFGNLVGQGSATQEEDFLFLTGDSPFGAYTGEMILDGDVMAGDLFDSFGNYLGSVVFTRDTGRF